MKLEDRLIEALDSGEPTEMTCKDWSEINEVALRQIEARKSQKSV